MHFKSIVMTCLLSISLVFLTGIRAETLAESNVMTCDLKFIKIFKEGRKNSDEQVINVSEDVEKYIRNCSKTPEEAVEILQKSGFDIYSKVYSSKEFHDSHMKKHFEKTIFGKKSAGWWPFWDLFTQYKVTFFFNDGKIEQISSYVVSDLPF